MSLPAEYFAERWGDSDDPWQIAVRWYERRKRDVLMACLPRERYRSGFEPGCAAGYLTARLAGRCDQLLAADTDPRAVALTRTRVADDHVRVERHAVPADWPDDRFDLIVVSELGYYLAADDLELLAARIAGSLQPGGTVVACHWRHSAPGHPSTAEQVHLTVPLQIPQAGHAVRHVEPDFLLDVWVSGEPSVARHEGWLP